jgi:hypothetical protein
MLAINSCPQCQAKLTGNLFSIQNCDYCHALLLRVNNEFSSIKCKGCFAPLKLEGELVKSKILICNYCTTAMDSESEFKALYTFSNIQKPNSALEVGMRGNIAGVEFSIVSLIVYRSRGVEWLEFMLYSKTDGYSKLIKKEGKYLFFNTIFEKTEQNIWLLKEADNFKIENKSFTIEKFYFTEIYYAVGNLNSKINQSQRSKQCFAKSGEAWFYSLYSLNNIVYYLGEVLDEVEESFNFS